MQKNPVVHFEMPADDTARMSNFYKEAFGWDTQDLGPEMDGYVLATTSDLGEDGMPKNPGQINGGFYKKPADGSMDQPNIVIGVEDIKKTIKAVEAAGGKLLGEPVEIPGFGISISFLDTEGNRVGVMQSLEEAK